MADEKELNPETMPLEELKALAAAEEVKEPEVKTAATAADVELPAEEADLEPEQYVVRSEIDLGDGSGVQVFKGTGATELEALRDQNTKLVEAQRNATKKIHDLNSRVKVEDARTDQQKTDDEYVIAQRLQKEPSKTMREAYAAMRAEEEAEKARSLSVQQSFVDTHQDYIADNDNGQRIMSEVQRLGYKEFTEDILEKAYNSLKKSGLLKLRAEEAGGTTEEETKEPQRIVETKAEATQPRSPRRASTVSTRGGGAPVTKAGPTEDELYSMPLDKLRQLSNEQLAKGTE